MKKGEPDLRVGLDVYEPGSYLLSMASMLRKNSNYRLRS